MQSDPIEQLTGTSESVPDDVDIWILISPTLSDNYYIQSHRDEGPADRLGDGRFVATASLGGDPGQTFEILVVLADERASADLTATLKKWVAANSYPGLRGSELPEGLIEVHCVAEVTHT